MKQLSEVMPATYAPSKGASVFKKGGTAKRLFKTKLAHEDQNLFHLRHSAEDNYQTNDEVLQGIFALTGWEPVIDLCSSVTGDNATAPFFYSSENDGRLQAPIIGGHDVICNPPYYCVQDYVDTLEQAWDRDHSTRALLVAPGRPSNPWFQHLNECAANVSSENIALQKPWRIVGYYL